MSTSETILIALGSSAAGGLLGSALTTMLRIRFEREEGLRARMLDAADDVASPSVEALLRTRDAAGLIIPEDYESDEPGQAYHDLTPEDADRLRDAIAEARRHVAKAHAAVPRTELLFGPDSDASKSAHTVVGTLRHVLDVLAEESPAEMSYAEGKLPDAYKAHARFSRDVRVAIEKPRLRPSLIQRLLKPATATERNGGLSSG